MNGEQDTPETPRPRRPSLVTFEVKVTRIDDTGRPEDDADFVEVLGVRVEVQAEFIPSVGYGANRSDGESTVLTLQQQIRAALEAARPGGN